MVTSVILEGGFSRTTALRGGVFGTMDDASGAEG